MISLAHELFMSEYYTLTLSKCPYSESNGSCVCIYDPQKSLNGILAVDLPFQTLAVDFSLNLWTVYIY